MWCTMSILKFFLIRLLDSTNCFPRSSIAFICFLPYSSIVSVCCYKAFPKGEYVNLAWSITLLWSEGNIALSVRYPSLSIFPDDNADTFAASLLISYCRFSSLILLSIVLISFYILSKRLFLKGGKGILTDSRVAFLMVFQ